MQMFETLQIFTMKRMCIQHQEKTKPIVILEVQKFV